MTDHLDIAMRKLSNLADTDPQDRVYEWRRLLDSVWRAGFDAGYLARRRDDDLAEREAARSLPEVATEG